ncbi:DNA primase [Roseovarius salis]|uniref:DNA primase n=1 Tax=Roseovarius salis TaxID=3376063 RepID=UPI0037CA4FC9
MSLPPGFLDELRTRLSLAQVVGRKVMWDTRKSNQGKGDMWAPCPFHQEKTASFHVDDRKGFYYCFGCHAKGDAISFVRETENVDFIEAVRILASEAGMQMPERDPQAQQVADRRGELAEIMEMAVRHFRMQLKTGAGAAARDYLAGRGLEEAALERFEIGFAPDAWQGMWDHLTGKGVEAQKILDCGLAKPSQKGGRPYDTFRDRIIFPIRDTRGRCIAFGGRAMASDASAKYLNSPETELFDKSRTLYNHAPAREAAGKGQPLIVAEGYMDVIALSEAGFGASVAPLGTAVTEHQLQLLWRMADEPVIALDGDQAGLRAAYRVIDLALPLLEAGKSLRFALMPEGQDPDDLLRGEGAPAVQAVLDQALPMVQLLWRRETQGRAFDSPERRAALDKALREQIARIRDPSIRHHYGQAVKELRWQLFNPRATGDGQAGPRKTRWTAPEPVRAATRASLLAAAGDDVQTQLREAVILATLILTPEVMEEFEDQLESMPCTAPEHARLRDLLLRHGHAGADSLRARIAEDMGADTVDNLCARPHVALAPGVRRAGDIETARQTVAEELAKLGAELGLRAEVAEASQDIAGMADETVTYRLSEAARTRQTAERSFREDQTEFELGENGAPVSRAERDAFEALLATIGFQKDRTR